MPPFLPYAPRNQDGDAKGGSLPPVNTFPGAVIGREDAYHPSTGDYPKGGTGQTLDKVKCAKQMFINRYHIHFYLGVISNGKQVALPLAIGMVNPGTVTNGFVNTASCYYYLHTHDESGIVHVEVPKNAPFTKPLYKLGTLFKVWGINVAATQFAHFHGPMHVFVGNVPLEQTTVTSYAPLKGKLEDLEIYSHEVVWIEIGTTYYKSKHLPPVTFYMEY